jgi:ubiquinone/menaquinone biosynthesis C-methylase UbiE
MNPKEIVARGYDRIGTSYAVWANGIESQARTKYTSVLLENLAFGAKVLELGCGSGTPTTKRLAERSSLTGVDISSEQINLARENIPAARFLCADMGQLDFPPASFDAVAAFYSIIHVPRDEHAALLQTIATWLRPGGLLVATMGAGSTEGDLVDDWLGWGAPM